MPHVSVVIPVFNAAKLVGAALRSVRAQTWQDFEIVVVDDGSEDRAELEAVLREWADRIQYVRQANGGPARARNTGIARTTGDLVAFLDADDEWLPEKLARQVAYFERYPETGLLHTATVGARPSAALGGPPRRLFCELYHTDFYINTLTVMAPRRVLDAVGGFDERREIHIEDWDLWLRIAAAYPLGYLDEPLARYRRGGGMSSQIERTYAAQALVMDKTRALRERACEACRRDPGRCDRRRRFVLHRDWGYDRFVAGDRPGARQQFARALVNRPLHARTAALYAATFVPGRRRRSPRASADAAAPSLVHDTLYRRARRRAVAYLHDVDDRVSRRARSRRQVMFEAASPMSFAIFKPLYQRLKSDSRVELWFTAHGRVWRPEDIYAAEGIHENVVPPDRARWMKVDLYVNADFWDMTWLHRRTRRIHLFHGVAGKYGLDAPVDLAPTIATFDSLLFVNTDRRRRYIDAGLVPDGDLAAALVGYPKVDALVDGSLDRAQIAAALDLDPRVPTVIYAPTWSPYSSLNDMGEQIVEGLAAHGVQVIVKLHDRSYDRDRRGSGGVDWAARLAKYDGHPLVRLARGGDSSPFLVASDLMVSDHSSIAFEYMLLDRPIVVVDRPELLRQAGVSPDKVGLLRSAAEVVDDSGSLVRKVGAALRHPERLSAERRGIAAQLFYRPGTATDRAMGVIYRLLDLEAPHSEAGGTVDVRAGLEPAGALRATG